MTDNGEQKAIRRRRRFEYTFEPAWKTTKDYLEAKGVSLTYPRDVLKQASKSGLIRDGETWLEMLDIRAEAQ